MTLHPCDLADLDLPFLLGGMAMVDRDRQSIEEG